MTGKRKADEIGFQCQSLPSYRIFCKILYVKIIGEYRVDNENEFVGAIPALASVMPVMGLRYVYLKLPEKNAAKPRILRSYPWSEKTP